MLKILCDYCVSVGVNCLTIMSLDIFPQVRYNLWLQDDILLYNFVQFYNCDAGKGISTFDFE